MRGRYTWRVGEEIDMKQKSFLNTCWSVKTQWYFFIRAKVFKVSFLAKFTLNLASQMYFLVLDVDHITSVPDLTKHCVFM